MYDWPHQHMWGMHWAWWIIALTLIVLAVLIFARALRPHPHLDRNRTAVDLLDERYAAGEISTEEYEERRRRLAPQ